MSAEMATEVRAPAGSCRSSQRAAPLTTVPVEPPMRNPCRARRRHIRTLSRSWTRTISSIGVASTSGIGSPPPGPPRRRAPAGAPAPGPPPRAALAVAAVGGLHQVDDLGPVPFEASVHRRTGYT